MGSSSSEPMKSPSDDVQAYLAMPEPIEIKSGGLDGTCLVSGWEVSPSVLFNLNDEDSAFQFTKIQVFTSDVSASRKSLLSREARYTGLYDKLDYMEASSSDVKLPTSSEELANVKSWVAIIDDVSDIQKIVDLCSSASSLKNLSLLLVNQETSSSSPSIMDTLKALDGKVDYSLVVVGELYDDIIQAGTVNLPPVCSYRDISSDEGSSKDEDDDDESSSSKNKFSKMESMKMVTEFLQLQSSVGKGVTMYEISEDSVNDSLDYKLIKGLREAGYTRPQEVDHMLRHGVTAYKEAIDKFNTENPNAAAAGKKNMYGDDIKTTNAWWEDEEFQKNVGIRKADDGKADDDDDDDEPTQMEYEPEAIEN